MAGQSTAVGAFDEVLKIRYEKGIVDALNQEQPVLNLMKRETEGWSGKQVTFPVKLGRNFSAAATAEGAAIHDAGAQTYKDFVVPVKYNHGRIQLTAAVMKASENSKGAFARALGSEIDGLVLDLANYRGRVIHGYGVGPLCLVNTDPSTGTTITVDAPMGVAGSVNGAKYIQPGMFVAFVNPSGPAIRAGGARTVTTVAADGASFDISAACDAAVADNDWVVIAQSASASAITSTTTNLEQMGLLGMVDGTTYVSTFHGIDRSTGVGTQLQATVIGSVGALSADVIQRGIDSVYQRSRGKTSHLIMEHATRRAYLVMMENDRRYMNASLMKPDAGSAAAKMGDLRFGEIPIIADKDCPYGTIFGIEADTFTRWILTEGEWADETGAILRFVANQDTYEAIYRIFDNFSCENGGRNFRLDGITVNAVVVHLP